MDRIPRSPPDHLCPTPSALAPAVTRAWAEGASRALFGPSGGATGSREDDLHTCTCVSGASCKLVRWRGEGFRREGASRGEEKETKRQGS